MVLCTNKLRFRSRTVSRKATFAIETRSALSTLSTSAPGTPSQLRHGINGYCRMRFEINENAIDEIVASCNGDIRGALKALMLVNERLEAELQQLHAAVAHGAATQRGSSALH
jgi:replication-associated recombination protein RarA